MAPTQSLTWFLWRYGLLNVLFLIAMAPAVDRNHAPFPLWYTGPLLMLFGAGFLIWRDEFAARSWQYYQGTGFDRSRRACWWSAVLGGVGFVVVGVVMLLIVLFR
jgi:hypothetical protein